ncbi:unnamed protein product [Ceutorhynchus assimilis]|uniref:Uncharacterized protein n=1 Tax=Ceutorhynchus assimilis TaxID=467358 RepID=A0A9N9QL86_9CUCU|nr:unnamed protein product [Ceutorhynchus assimilis]
MQERERPKIPPKPIIATKPKYVPPVKIQQRPPVPQNALHTRKPSTGDYVEKRPTVSNAPRRSQGNLMSTFHPTEQKSEVYFLPQNEKEPLYPRREDTLAQRAESLQEQFFGGKKQETQILSTFASDKFYKKTLEVSQKPPNSPSTVCCSILSNAATDCCGIINVAKINGKMTKLDSVDSNSSDSGGFKDFIPPPMKDPQFHHQRKISQPDFLNDRKLSEARPQGHQRKTSQPNFDSKPKGYVANAQALAHFLPQTEQKILMHNQKTDEARTRQPKPILSQQSTKKLEELLAQRLEKEKVLKKGGQNCTVDGDEVEQKMRIQRQIQQKLHADLEQTVKQIQEIQNTEYRLPQNRKWNEDQNKSSKRNGLEKGAFASLILNVFRVFGYQFVTCQSYILVTVTKLLFCWPRFLFIGQKLMKK